MLGPVASQAQSQFEPQLLPTCTADPPPDTWPVAGTDSLGAVISGASATFSSATLLANDIGTSLTVVGVAPLSANGGTIAGTGPFTYTPAAGFAGADLFTYEITNPAAQTTIGLVKLTVIADVVAPVVSITAPAAGATVAGSVVVSASATDNARVAGVTFFDGTTQIGAEVLAAPFQTTWNTTLVADGTHNLTAVARDPSGNASTSAVVAVTVSNAVVAPPATPVVDKSVFSNGLGKRTTPAFSTTSPGEVLLAFAASDGPAAGNSQTLTITGAGLAWTRVQRAATQFGVSEIWTATASTVLTNVAVSSTQAATGYYQSLRVITFTGASGVGASNIATAPTGAPTVSLVAQAAGSVVYAVGNDWDQAIARTIPAGQTKVHEFLAPVGDTFWVQALNGTTAAAGSTVTLNATAPTTDQWNFAIVELKAGGAPPVASVIVPNVVGLTQAAAETKITDAGLAVGTVTRTNSDTVPAGQVISQNPGAGASAVRGSAVALVVSLGPAPAPTPGTGLVAAYGFEEGSGLGAADSSGNAMNGSIRGALFAPGKFGMALQFDGVDDWVTVTDVTGSPLDLTTAMTLEAWVNPSEMSGWETVMLKERGAGLLSYALYAHDGAPLSGGFAVPAGYIRAGGVDQPVRGISALPLNTWTHVATTYDGTTQRIYVDGVLVTSRPQAGPIAVGNGALRMGGNASFTGEFFQGLIDEVRIYNRALSLAEIQSDMATPVRP